MTLITSHLLTGQYVIRQKTTGNSSHPLSGFLRQNEIFSFNLIFSTFDKIAVQSPAQSGGCNPLVPIGNPI